MIKYVINRAQLVAKAIIVTAVVDLYDLKYNGRKVSLRTNLIWLSFIEINL